MLALAPSVPDQSIGRICLTADNAQDLAARDALLADDSPNPTAWTSGPYAALAWARQLTGGAR